MARMTGGEAIVDGLVRHGIDTVFGLPGVQTYGLFDAFARASNQLRLINARHEQTTAYMALGYACATGRPSAYAVVPGPGVLNTTAALATAWGVNAPVLCLTGQVPSQMIGRLRGQLHELPDQLAHAALAAEMGGADFASVAGVVSRCARVPGDAVRPARTGGAGDAVGPVHRDRGRHAAGAVAAASQAGAGPGQDRRTGEAAE